MTKLRRAFSRWMVHAEIYKCTRIYGSYSPRWVLALHFPHVTPVFAYPYPGEKYSFSGVQVPGDAPPRYTIPARFIIVTISNGTTVSQPPFSTSFFPPSIPSLYPRGSFRHRITPPFWTRPAVSFERTAAKVAYMINRTFPAGCCLSVYYVETLAEGLNFIFFAHAADVQEWSLERGLWHRRVSITTQLRENVW